ncbi:hypothetical protein EV426DRAFT_540753 [Tirmania nivea]|nr:hypothetical protein EV426DRAFT_540753 [Tirmania nivea]
MRNTEPAAYLGSRGRRRRFTRSSILLIGLLTLPIASTQQNPPNSNCIALTTSKMCPAFSTSQISVKNTDKFPFLQFVNTTDQFDVEFERYIRTDYPVAKFKIEFGCPLDNFSNTTHLYAQYTRSQLCSAMIQESISDCQLKPENSKPLCLENCGQWASSEWQIVADKSTCGASKVDYTSLIKSDFAICTHPENSLKRALCVDAAYNEGYNCGFSENLPGLCLHCQDGTVNSTETCCYEANAEQRCQGVKLPTIVDVPPDLIPTESAAPKQVTGNGGGSNQLTAGAIAGVVIGSIIALCLVIFLILYWRRRKQIQASALYLNRPSPHQRTSPERNMAYAANPNPNPAPQTPVDHGAGGRIARMSALESRNASRNASMAGQNSPPPLPLQERPSHRIIRSTSAEFRGLEDSPNTRRSAKYTGDSRPPHPAPRDRNASLSSTSILVSERHGSDSEKEDGSGVVGSPVSEQLPYFKDYYSKDDIHPDDKVSVLWAYSPRAADEFELERGDMLKVVGIWDDGWATGIRLNDRAEDYIKLRTQRDSGVSASQNSRLSMRQPTPTGDADIKAFPLVCVCLPEHWQKTIDNDGVDYTSTHTIEGQLSDPESHGKRIQKEPSSRFREDMNPQGGPSP